MSFKYPRRESLCSVENSELYLQMPSKYPRQDLLRSVANSEPSLQMLSKSMACVLDTKALLQVIAHYNG
ncbi:hypothetical protein Plhal304r1_c086g0169471 [Plasmopara halstedii]